MSRKVLLLLTALVASPLAAQQTTPPPSQVEQGGLTGSVSDENAWQDLGIAIPGFATDRDVATPAGQSNRTWIECRTGCSQRAIRRRTAASGRYVCRTRRFG